MPIPRPQRRKLTPEQRKEEREYRESVRLERKHESERKKLETERRKLFNREMKVLKYMAKTGVAYYHHNREDSMKDEVIRRIEKLNRRKSEGNLEATEYDPYGWNWGVRCPGLSLLGCVWSGTSEHETIYDVPLDGTYVFSVYDSGERGLGARNRITATKVEEPVKVPKVNPGAIFPITAP